MKLFIVLAIIAASCWALPTEDAAATPAREQARGFAQNSIHGEDLVATFYTDCLRKDSISNCLKLKLFSFMDQVVGARESFHLTEGISVVRTEDQANSEGAPRSAVDDSSMVDKLQRFLSSHTLKIDVKGSDVVNAVSSAGRALGEVADTVMAATSGDEVAEESARGKVKKAGKLLGPLLLGIVMKAAILAPLALGAIALIAGKALIIGKIALLLSAIIGLKKLLAGQQKTVTYEVVSHPHYSHSSSSGHDSYSAGSSAGNYASSGTGSSSGGWGRSIDVKPAAAVPASAWDAQHLAYSAQSP